MEGNRHIAACINPARLLSRCFGAVSLSVYWEWRLAPDVPRSGSMQNAAASKVRWFRATSVVLLLFALLCASYACAAMPPSPSAAHPCCPKSGHSSSGSCESMGCFSTTPVLLSIPVDTTIDLAVVGPVSNPVPVEYSLERRAMETARSSQPGPLYLIHQLFLL
jgi:hypothetical protein